MITLQLKGLVSVLHEIMHVCGVSRAFPRTYGCSIGDECLVPGDQSDSFRHKLTSRELGVGCFA